MTPNNNSSRFFCAIDGPLLPRSGSAHQESQETQMKENRFWVVIGVFDLPKKIIPDTVILGVTLRRDPASLFAQSSVFCHLRSRQ